VYGLTVELAAWNVVCSSFGRPIMRIAVVAPPFIPVPPVTYGGTELFVAHLAEGLSARGHDVVVYANGDSRVRCRVKWRYRHSHWPVEHPAAGQLKNADHSAWAIHDASLRADLVHINDAVGVPFSTFIEQPVVMTLHHPHEPVLSALYEKYPGIQYVAISGAQARLERMPRIAVVYHGIDLARYRPTAAKEDYVVFLGRMAPCKGPHSAIEAARRAGVRLLLAGEIQPTFRDYWDQRVAPLLGGDIEYVGEADLALKTHLLSRARALLFPIDWQEPFGLVMIEAMACGTPVLAFAGGSVEEIVCDGVSGWICRDAADMADRIAAPPVPSESCRAWAADRFSVDTMVRRYVELYEQAIRPLGVADLPHGSDFAALAGEAASSPD
jgi:glycosyltransferase involved in cell wall biosynthesis